MIQDCRYKRFRIAIVDDHIPVEVTAGIHVSGQAELSSVRFEIKVVIPNVGCSGRNGQGALPNDILALPVPNRKTTRYVIQPCPVSIGSNTQIHTKFLLDRVFNLQFWIRNYGIVAQVVAPFIPTQTKRCRAQEVIRRGPREVLKIIYRLYTCLSISDTQLEFR